MKILVFKLLITPLLIGAVTMAGRRWGVALSGMLIGLPLTSGPISFILACEYGVDFAAKAAIGGMVGQVSICLFCLAYSFSAMRTKWLLSSVLSATTFLALTCLWNLFSWSLLISIIALFFVIAVVSWIMPAYPALQVVTKPSKWDLPARMAIATVFVFLLTTFANKLGPQLSGLIAPFPVFAIVFGAFTHRQQGPEAVTRLLRGIVQGSVSYALFFMIVGLYLEQIGIMWTYLLSTVAAVFAGCLLYLIKTGDHTGKWYYFSKA
jgi:hypothetical protein